MFIVVVHDFSTESDGTRSQRLIISDRFMRKTWLSQLFEKYQVRGMFYCGFRRWIQWDQPQVRAISSFWVNSYFYAIKTSPRPARRTWRFLEFDELFVSEGRPVVDEGEGVAGVASGAQSWLTDTTAVHFYRFGEVADAALEECFAHVRDDVACPDDHAIDGNQPVDICRKQFIR